MTDTQDSAQGLAYAVGAYVLWGFLPLYLKLIDHIPAIEVVAHRILWSVPIAFVAVAVMGQLRTLVPVLHDPRTLAMAALTAALISVNWSVYVYAIATEHAVEAALGYYINPLFSVLLGAVVLRERLDTLQWTAIALAACAVGVLTYDAGRVPLLGLVLMLSFGLYALAKKRLAIGANQGFLLEVLILSIPALAYVAWLEPRGQGSFAANPWLLIGCGFVTAVPLMLFAQGARRLLLSTTGILQYIAPTMILVIAVFVFGEAFGAARAIAFPLIWAALVLYSISLFRKTRPAHG
ncbi:MAG: EamA family transporter RarD [Pseudomonadota bacterium]